jgi:hypothetical protein
MSSRGKSITHGSRSAKTMVALNLPVHRRCRLKSIRKVMPKMASSKMTPKTVIAIQRLY